ncbi:hypothetical protein LCL61_17210 [Amycolatopsis coloradensis]|uniref:Uncharacterized protein n=1 Tax=Amycolatopsis coloradensis TaxID=76021 RepID=A0ACD5BD87_9PSEU
MTGQFGMVGRGAENVGFGERGAQILGVRGGTPAQKPETDGTTAEPVIAPAKSAQASVRSWRSRSSRVNRSVRAVLSRWNKKVDVEPSRVPATAMRLVSHAFLRRSLPCRGTPRAR